jgi:DNA-binding NarL/FixJ family response regulator
VTRKLTSREQQVANLAGQGLQDKEIASKLGISPGTVKIHMQNIFRKLGVRNRTQLATWESGAETPYADLTPTA